MRLVGLGGAGQTWDEDVNWAAGRNYITNLLVARLLRAPSWSWNYEHPPVMKLLDGIGAQFADGFGPARALSALWIVARLRAARPDRHAAVPAPRRRARRAAIAALLPPLVAHGQIVGHESPTVLWWSLGDPARARRARLPAVRRPRAAARCAFRLAWVGVVIGVAIASRFVNGLLGPLCALIVVVQAPQRWRRADARAGARS